MLKNFYALIFLFFDCFRKIFLNSNFSFLAKEFRVLTEWESTDFWLYGSAELANKGGANKGWYDSNLSSTARPKSGIEIDFWDLQMGTIISGQVVTDTFTVCLDCILGISLIKIPAPKSLR